MVDARATGTVTELSLDSRALGRAMDVMVITPPGYDEADDTLYPVLYYLHPWGLSPRYIVDKLRMHHHLWHGIARGDLPPMVIALPSGDKSFYINAEDPPGYDWESRVDMESPFFRDALALYGDYGDYLLGEVIPTIETQFHVRTDRAGRAIGGISMGGTAAALHAFKDPGAFSAVGIHSPALCLGPPEQPGPPWIFGLTRESFARHNPADVVRGLAPEAAPRVYLDVGDRDPMVDTVEALHAALEETGIPHTYHRRPGGHDKSYWEPHMTEYLAFYAENWA